MRWYGHILRMNLRRIAKNILNTQVKGKWPSGRQRSRLKQVRKDVTQNEGRKTIGRN
jgi:hypothetical protein